MTINLPHDLEDALCAEVSSGHFASLDDAMAEAVRLLLRNRAQRQPEAHPDTSLGSIGAMRDAADELDEIVADAYRKRQQEPYRWRAGANRPPHLLIAAIASTHGLELATGNTAHFQRVQRLGYPLTLSNWRIP